MDVYASSEEFVERIDFYLKLADGHYGSYNFKFSFDQDMGGRFETSFGKKDISEIRQVLSQKAFQVLCQKVFKNTGNDHAGIPSWIYIVAQKGVLEKIIQFFKPDEEGRIENRMAEEKHLSEIVEKFLMELCKLIWSENEEAERHGKWPRKTYPNLIEILHGIRKLDLLFDSECGKIRDEDGLVLVEVMDKLAELSLKCEIWVNSGFRKPTSIDEAYYGDSQAAKAYILLSVKNAERKRLEEIRELEMQKTEAEKKLKKLKK
jgi:hypothetical protein